MIIDENSKPREKLKAWYLFTDDFIAGTQHLTNLEVFLPPDPATFLLQYPTTSFVFLQVVGEAKLLVSLLNWIF